MKVLMFSGDAKIFEKGSVVRARMIEYGKLFDWLHIVVVSKGNFENEMLSGNVVVNHEPVNDVLEGAWKVIPGISTKAFGGTDIVTAQDPFEIGAIAHSVAKKLGIPLQIQLHTDIFSKNFTYRNFKNFLRKEIAKKYLFNANCVRVVSSNIRYSLIQNLAISGKKISILPIFIDVEKIKNAQPASFPKKFDFTVLWVGRLEKEKNCSLAVDAFAQFIKHVPSAGLVIVGDGSERKKLELQVTNYKLQEKVVFLGWQNDIVGYYKSADVLLATSNYEGYGLQMVEARIAGLPVIAPDVGVAREVGAHITDHTAGGIARMLARLHDGSLSKQPEYEYPYRNKQQYLELYKKSFEQCLKEDKKI